MFDIIFKMSTNKVHLTVNIPELHSLNSQLDEEGQYTGEVEYGPLYDNAVEEKTPTEIPKSYITLDAAERFVSIYMACARGELPTYLFNNPKVLEELLYLGGVPIEGFSTEWKSEGDLYNYALDIFQRYSIFMYGDFYDTDENVLSYVNSARNSYRYYRKSRLDTSGSTPYTNYFDARVFNLLPPFLAYLSFPIEYFGEELKFRIPVKMPLTIQKLRADTFYLLDFYKPASDELDTFRKQLQILCLAELYNTGIFRPDDYYFMYYSNELLEIASKYMSATATTVYPYDNNRRSFFANGHPVKSLQGIDKKLTVLCTAYLDKKGIRKSKSRVTKSNRESKKVDYTTQSRLI